MHFKHKKNAINILDNKYCSNSNQNKNKYHKNYRHT